MVKTSKLKDIKLGSAVEVDSAKVFNSREDWRHPRLLKSGETDGFKWYIGEYDLPFPRKILDPLSLAPLDTSTIRLAYVDVTGTKLDGISDVGVINRLGIELFCGCTFAGQGEHSSLLRHANAGRERWFIGEDYAHGQFGFSSDSVPEADANAIEEHIKTETIPSIIKSLVKIDLSNPNFDGVSPECK